MKRFAFPLIVIAMLLIVACTPTTPPPPPPEAATESVATEAAAETDQVAVAQAVPIEAPTETAPTEAVAEPTAAPTDTPAPPPTPTGPLPPVVVQTSPESGAEQPLDQPLEIRFDQPMVRDSVEQAFAIEPGASVDGSFEWVNDSTLRFAFANGFERGRRYRVRVVESAENQAGLTLQTPFEYRFSAVGFLDVTNVQPADGTGEVAADSSVVVMFNRPVVPLGALSQAGSLPDPLTFTPPLSGEGEWVNTAMYRFTPEGGFEPATAYTARVAQGLTDVTGSALLTDDFTWSFTTVSPAVVAGLPAPNDLYVSPTPVISVAFNQPMDRAAVEQNLLLIEAASGGQVRGQFEWQAGGITPPTERDPNVYYETPPDAPEPIGVETVVFTPLAPLSPGADYQLLLPQGVPSAAGSATQSDYRADFTVSPLPAVVSTNPSDGEQFADIWQGFEVTFNAPMDPASVRLGDSLLIAPDVAATDVYTSWSDSDTRLNVNFPRRENRTYTVTLTADVVGRYGQPLGQDVTVTWKTLRQSPYVYLVSPKIGVYNGYRPETYIYMTVRNVAQVNFELYSLSADEFQQLAPQSNRGFQQGYEWNQFNPQSGQLVASWSQNVAPEQFENFVYRVDLSQAAFNGQPLPPGIYYLEAFSTEADLYDNARMTDSDQATDRQILIVSKRSLTTKQGGGDLLVWLTDLQSGQPVADAPLSLTAPDGRDLTGATAADGTAVFSYTVTPENSYSDIYVFAGDTDQPGDDFAVGGSKWNSGIAPYDFGYLFDGGGFAYDRTFAGHIYAERPLYRPGQTVYFKGIIRRDNDAGYTIPQGETAQVKIYDAMYRQVYSNALTLNPFGTFNGSFELDPEASLGRYQLEVVVDDPVWGQNNAGFNSFTVAEYRKPEFLVDVTTDRPEYRAGETIDLTATAEFFSGGPVANAEVRWTLLSDDYYFDYQGEGYYSFTAEDSTRANDFNPNFGGGFGEQIASGSGITDEQGVFSLQLPADLTGRRTSRTYTFDVAITGLNNQEVAAQTRAIVHKGELYVGVRSLNYVAQIGQPTDIEALVVDWDSQPAANQQVEIAIAREEWYSVQQQDPAAGQPDGSDEFYWTNLVDNVAVFTAAATTNSDGLATISFTPEDGGSYRVIARTVDGSGAAVFATTFVWASGFQYVNWGQEDNDRIELVADQPEYNTGDTATILVPHPYSGTVTALVSLERGQIYDHFVTELDSNSAQLEIPITEGMSPNIYVSVMVLDGMRGEAGVPSFKLGYARLPIDPAEKLLNISLTPTPLFNPPPSEGGAGGGYRPGDTVEYQVEVTDFEGNPVEAELSLALIDKSILTLMPEAPGQLEEAFWQRRALQVETGSSLTLALDRINRALDERKGGGGGDGGAGADSVRQNFADTALWLPTFTTDAGGVGSFEVTLPDNLTTWVLLAKGVTQDETLVGEQRDEIITSKPLLVRPVTPRFFTVGDAAQLGLVVQNNTAETLTVTPAFTATGLEIGQWRIDGGAWQSPDQENAFTLDAGREIKVDYQTTVSGGEEVQLTMGAQSATGLYGDAVAFSLPVYQPAALETTATAGVLGEDGTRIEGVLLPPTGDYVADVGGLSVTIEPSLAGGIQAGLTYLEHFPYECTEQTVSRFLPNIFTARAVEALALEQPALTDGLERYVQLGLQKLYVQQNSDGGWGWWPGDGSDPTLTAYVTLGLVEADRAGFTVEQYVRDNAVSFLEDSLVAPQDIAAPWRANQQAFVLYVLAEAGQSDLGRMTTLFEQRAQLGQYGRAFLALGFHLADPEADAIATLVSDLSDSAVLSATGAHWEENGADVRAMNTDVRSTAIIINALSRIQPDHPLLPQAVRWLMTVRREGGYWPTTQETAWSIIGLTNWLVASGELAADYQWQASLNGQDLAGGDVSETNLTESRQLHVEIGQLLAGEVNRLAIERDSAGDGAGQLYYTAFLNYGRPLAEVKALDRGLTIQRQYSLLDGDGGAINQAEVGDFIRVKLTLIAPTDLHHVMVEDYLPAGTEALDSSLATTSLAAQAPRLSAAEENEPWGWWYFTHTDLRDEKAVLFATYLPQGVYEYSYTIRASLPGEYHVRPTRAEQMYFPDVFGRSDGALFTVVE